MSKLVMDVLVRDAETGEYLGGATRTLEQEDLAVHVLLNTEPVAHELRNALEWVRRAVEAGKDTHDDIVRVLKPSADKVLQARVAELEKHVTELSRRNFELGSNPIFED